MGGSALPFNCAFGPRSLLPSSRWELLFNAIVLACLSRLDEDDEEAQQSHPRWSWAFAAEATSDCDDRAGH